jgi:hypothetical protein
MAEVSEIFVNGVLASTIINQLISPPLIKLALIKSGEAGQVTEYPDVEVDRQH